MDLIHKLSDSLTQSVLNRAMYVYDAHRVIDIEHVVVSVPGDLPQGDLSTGVHHERTVLIEQTKEGGASGTTL